MVQADANDDEVIDLFAVIIFFNYIAGSGPPPAAPGPVSKVALSAACGRDLNASAYPLLSS